MSKPNSNLVQRWLVMIILAAAGAAQATLLKGNMSPWTNGYIFRAIRGPRQSSRRLHAPVAPGTVASKIPHITSVDSPIQEASCRLVLKGYGSLPKSHVDLTDNKLNDQGLVSASLSCTTKPPGLSVPLAINSTWVTPQMLANFEGVSVVKEMDCKKQLEIRQAAVYGLLYFCGSYKLILEQPNVQGVHIHTPLPKIQADDLVAWQGAILVFGGDIRAQITQAAITNNSAGSPLTVMMGASVQISQGSEIGFNKAVWGGSAFLVDNGQLTVTGGSMLHNNSVLHSGGAVQCMDGARLVVKGGALVTGNSARFYGGGLHCAETCRMLVTDGAKVAYNNASYGGGTAIKNSGFLMVANATYEANNGQYGGGVAAQHSGHFVSTDGALFKANTGLYGGAVAAQNMCNITFTGRSRLIRNTALYGGVLAVQDDSVTFIGGNSYFDGNSNPSGYGGSIAVQNSARAYVRDSLFVNGQAFYGGVVVLQNTGNITLGPGSVFRNNTGVFGGVVGAIEEARVTLDNATLEDNTGTNGGAISVINMVHAFIKGGTVIRNNTGQYGGGLSATLFCQVTLGDCRIENNRATVDGGGLHFSDTASLTITPAATTPVTRYASQIIGNRAKGLGGGVFFSKDSKFDAAALIAVTHGNKAQYDQEVSVPLKKVVVLGPTYIPGVASRFNRTSGTFNVSIKLVGTGGLPCGGRQVQATLQSPHAVQVLAVSRSNASGRAVLSDIKLRERAGNYTLLVSSTTDTSVPPAKIVVEVRHCLPGEVTNELGDACEPCSPGSFSLDPANFSCDACPVHAKCPGGVQLIPDEGFWHSSVSSPQLHACPNPKACAGNRTELLTCAAGINPNSTATACKPPPSPLNVAHDTQTLSYLDLLCADEYSGNLCGNCKPGYGASTAFTCRACLPRSTAAALYMTAIIAVLIFVRLLAYMTAVDNEASADATAAAIAAAAANAPTPAPANPQQKLAAAAGSGSVLHSGGPSVLSEFKSCGSGAAVPDLSTQPPALRTGSGRHSPPGRISTDTAFGVSPRASPTPGNDPASQLVTDPQGLLALHPQQGLQNPGDTALYVQPEIAEQPSPFAAMQDPSKDADTTGMLANGDVSMIITPEFSTDVPLPLTGDQEVLGHNKNPGNLAATAGYGSKKLPSGLSADLLGMKFSSGSIVGAAPGGTAAPAGPAAAPAAAAGGGGGAVVAAGSGALGVDSEIARASDILRDFVLYMQYMVLIGTLRVPWPETLHWPIRALSWFWSASSSETLALECLVDPSYQLMMPIAIIRTLFYTGMPLAVFVFLLGIEAAIRLALVVVPAFVALAAAGFRRTGAFHALSRSGRFPGLRRFILKHSQKQLVSGSTLPGTNMPDSDNSEKASFITLFAKELRKGFEGYTNNIGVIAGTVIFFFLPSVVRYGLSLFVCVKMDDPDFVPYPWTAATPGTYFLHDLNQQCWEGWHKYWALLYGIPLIVLTCVALPVGIAALVWFNKAHLQEPWFKRKHGSLYRIFRPKHAAWGAVIVLQTIVLVGITVFGMALGPYHQTLAMSAAFAGTLVLIMLFKPFKHKQQQKMLVFAFGSLYATTLAALTFMPSYDGTTPPTAYNTAMGACVLVLQLGFIFYALLQLKRSLSAEWSLSKFADKVLNVLKKAERLLPKSCVGYMSERLSSYSSGSGSGKGGNMGKPGPAVTAASLAGKNACAP